MKFGEALENIGTSSSNVEGIKKKVGNIVRRKIPAGYTKIDVEKDDDLDDLKELKCKLSGDKDYMEISLDDEEDKKEKE